MMKAVENRPLALLHHVDDVTAQVQKAMAGDAKIRFDNSRRAQAATLACASGARQLFHQDAIFHS